MLVSDAVSEAEMSYGQKRLANSPLTKILAEFRKFEAKYRETLMQSIAVSQTKDSEENNPHSCGSEQEVSRSELNGTSGEEK